MNAAPTSPPARRPHAATRPELRTGGAASLLLALVGVMLLSSQSAGANTATGAIASSFSVGHNGDAAYHLQIEVPPGISGAEPMLGLAYGSLGRNGIIGVGWQLSGLSTVRRCRAIPDIDGFRGGVSYGPEDRYCLDGQRLISVSGADGAAGSVYRTELDTWRLVEASESTCGVGPCSFTVTTRRGDTWSYGTSEDSRVTAIGRPDVRVWALNEVRDLNGNAVRFTYTEQIVAGEPEDAQLYPLRIDYTANAAASVEANRSVRFGYRGDRPDVETIYIGGSPVITRGRLTNIGTFVGETPVKDYRLSYLTSPATGRSLLREVKECAGPAADALCLGPTLVAWQGDDKLKLETVDLTPVIAQDDYQILPADIDADGRGDLIYIAKTLSFYEVYAYRSTGEDLEECPGPLRFGVSEYPLQAADIDGDGRTDLVQFWEGVDTLRMSWYTASQDDCGFVEPAENDFDTRQPLPPGELWPADVDGDGRTDILGVWSEGSGEVARLQVIRSLGDGFELAGSSTIALTSATLRLWPMDVNADGLIDLVQAWRDQGQLVLTSYLSDGSQLGEAIDSPQQAGADSTPWWPVEVNADGQMDLVQGWLDADEFLQLSSYISDGIGGFVAGGSSSTELSGIDFLAFWPFDATGDAMTDIVQAWSPGAGEPPGLVVYRNRRDGFDEGSQIDTALSGADIPTVWPLDLNGDGRIDLLQSWADENVLRHTAYLVRGAVPDLITSISDGLGQQIDIAYRSLADLEVYSSRTADYPRTDARGHSYLATPAERPYQVVSGGTMQVVSAYSHSRSEGQGGPPFRYRFEMSYAGAKIDRQGRGWLGFEEVVRSDPGGGRRTVTSYNQDFPLTGTVHRIEHRCVGGGQDPRCSEELDDAPLSASTTTYQVAKTAQGTLPNQAIYEVRRSHIRFDHYSYGEYEFSRGRAYAYDALGEVELESDFGYVTPPDEPGQAFKDVTTEDNVYTCMAYVDEYSGPAEPWKLGYLQDIKTSALPTCHDFEAFTTGIDFALEHVTYDDRRNLATHVRYDDGNRVDLTTIYTYDQLGNLSSIVQPGERATRFTYDDTYYTFPLSRRSPPNRAGRELIETYGWDPRFGALVATVDANQRVRISCLDEFGRLAATQAPIPEGTRADPDPSCVPGAVTGPRDIFERAPVLTTQTLVHRSEAKLGAILDIERRQDWIPGETRRQLLLYDARGRVYGTALESAHQQGDILACRTYDENDRVTAESLPVYTDTLTGSCDAGADLPWNHTTYDAYGRPVELVMPAGPDGEETTVTAFAYRGDTTTITLAAEDPYAVGKVYTYGYFRGVRKVEKITLTEVGQPATTFTYDRIGRLIEVVDPPTAANPQGVANRIAYDSLDRRVWIDNPDQNTTGDGEVRALRFDYSPRTGFLQSMADAKGQTTTFVRDPLGRPYEETWADGSRIAFEYDDPEARGAQGELSRVTGYDQEGAVAYQYRYTYDPQGLRDRTTLTLGDDRFVSTMGYDPLGRLRRLTYPDGSELERNYRLGNLERLTLDGVTYATYEAYTAQGFASTVTFGTGESATATVSSFAYSPNGERIRQVVENSSGARLLDLTTDWNHLRQVSGIEDHLQPGGINHSQSFDYTETRLTGAQADELYGQLTFEYDASGNLVGTGGLTYTYQAHRVVAGRRGDDEILTAAYDPNGNLVSKVAGGTDWRYSYDARNRLIGVNRDGDSVLGSLLYDHQGRRLRKEGADGTVSLYVGGHYLVTQLADGSRLDTKYVIGDEGVAAAASEPLSTAAGLSAPASSAPEVRFYTLDHLGSTLLTTEADGQVASRFAYMPYGGVFAPTSGGSDDVRQKFQGKELDEDEGVYFFGARYYDASIARFLSPDTRLASNPFETDSFNRFAFALNNPATYVDPTGHSVWESLLGGVIGGLEIVAGVAIDILSEGTLEPLGGALIGAGLNAIDYSLRHGNSFAWKQYGIQTGVGAAMGLVTGGVGVAARAGISAVREAAALQVDSVTTETLASAEQLDGRALNSGMLAADEMIESSETALDREEIDLSVCAFTATSFLADAEILTEDGYQRAETITLHDRVVAYDETQDRMGLFLVTGADSVLGSQLAHVALEDGKIAAAAEQLFWIEGRGWTPARSLAPDDVLRDSQNRGQRVVGVDLEAGPFRFYTFEVAEAHTFFVGSSEILAHNPPKACKKRKPSARLAAMGRTPGKSSKAGRAVIARMKKNGWIKGTGKNQQVKVPVAQGGPRVWKPMDAKIHMGHIKDAVIWWNKVGYKYGAKAKAVRSFMLDDSNYELEYGPLNSSNGAQLKQTYVPPNGWQGKWPP